MHNVYVAPITTCPVSKNLQLTKREQPQPPVLPRPDLNALGVKYRRIPLMSIGRDVYCDTRLILQKLEKHFPNGALGSSQVDGRALQKLLEIWTVDGGVFNRAAQLIPSSMPLLNDPKFTKDQEDLTGRRLDQSPIEAFRPEALAHIRTCFDLLETTLLADDREWVLKTKRPSLADIEGMTVDAVFAGSTHACNSNMAFRLARRHERSASAGDNV